MLLTITRMGLDRGQSQEPADEDENLPQCDLQQNNQAAVVLETYVVVWPLDLSFLGILLRNFQPKNGIDKYLLQVMFTIRGRAEKEPRISIPVPAVPVSELLAGKNRKICKSLN